MVTSAAVPLIISNIEPHIYEVLPGAPWTPAAIPPGEQLVSLALSVIVASPSNFVTDHVGVTIADLPAGYSLTWTADTNGLLAPPDEVNAGAGSGRILITATFREF